MTEDLPEEHNRVTLDPEMTDSNGIPAVYLLKSLILLFSFLLLLQAISEILPEGNKEKQHTGQRCCNPAMDLIVEFISLFLCLILQPT